MLTTPFFYFQNPPRQSHSTACNLSLLPGFIILIERSRSSAVHLPIRVSQYVSPVTAPLTHCITRFVGVYPFHHLLVLPAHKLERCVAALSESSNDEEGPGPCRARELSHPFPAWAPPLTAPCSVFLGNIESRCKSPCAAPTQNHHSPRRLASGNLSSLDSWSLQSLSCRLVLCRPPLLLVYDLHLPAAYIHCPVVSLPLVSAYPIAAASTHSHLRTTHNDRLGRQEATGPETRPLAFLFHRIFIHRFPQAPQDTSVCRSDDDPLPD